MSQLEILYHLCYNMPMLRKEFESQDFIEVMKKNFHKQYPSDEEKEVIWEFYEKECKALFSKPVSGERAMELQKVVHAFLMPKLKLVYKKELGEISEFIQRNKLSHPQVSSFKVKPENGVWIFLYKGVEILRKPRKGVSTILKDYLKMESPSIVVALTKGEREGIFQAVFGKYIKQIPGAQTPPTSSSNN